MNRKPAPTFAFSLRFVRCATALALVAALAGCDGDAATPTANAARGDTIAAGGVVEPRGEERVLIPELGGRLKRVLIAEGDSVKAGQLVAEIDNAEHEAAALAARAQLAQRRAELERLVRGARREERDAVRAELDEAVAAETLAASELERRRAMLEKSQVSRETVDQAQANHDATKARRARAAAAHALVEAGAREEDLAIAQAQLEAALADVARAEALLEKTRIRSPIDGVVLKRDLNEGETVVALSPIPLARIGDLSRLYVRADIDELDLARVAVGQRAHATSDAFPGRRFAGRVESVSRRMGRRNAPSEDPTEKRDATILEALIALDEGAELPIGLRVDVVIAPDAR